MRIGRICDNAAQQLRQPVERDASVFADAVPGALRVPRPAHAETLPDPPGPRHRRHSRAPGRHRRPADFLRGRFLSLLAFYGPAA